MKKLAVLPILLAISIAFTGCFWSSITGKSTIKTNDGTVTTDKNGIEIKDKDGSTTSVNTGDSKGTSLPEGYPKDIVPVIDGAKIVMSAKNQDANKKITFVIALESKKEITEVGNFYKDVMENAEEKVESEVNNWISIGGKKAKNNVLIIVSDNPSDSNMKSLITISIEPITE